MGRGTRIVLQAAAIGVVASLVALLAWQVATKEESAGLVKAVERGETPAAPAFDLPVLGDKEDSITLASLRGKAVVLNFWASWCEPCKEEAPMLEEVWQEYRDRDVVVLGVNAQDFTSDARGFVERYGMTYPVVHDGPGSSLGRYGLTGFPETWWIDPEGRLVAYHQGPVEREDIVQGIERALSSS
jgi:cytochrome c biogenesis protein CcmG/thiol:disulfide interchange protein DsbE